MRIEIQRLANEIQQGLSSATTEKQLLNEEVHLQSYFCSDCLIPPITLITCIFYYSNFIVILLF